MPIALVNKAVAALTVLNLDHLDQLPPAERRRLADICRHVARLADPQAAQAPAFRSSTGEHARAAAVPTGNQEQRQ